MVTCGSLLVFAAGIISSNGHPIDPKVVLPVTNGFGITIIGAALLITSVVVLVACTCCKQRRDGFKPSVEEVICKEEFRNPPASSHLGFTNNLSELAIFPPAVTVQQQRPSSADGSTPQVDAQTPSRPAAFSCVVPSITDWFDRNGNFPRQQLFYQKEIGKGWFGKVVKGEARGAKVVVRILREDATPEEKGYFLHEAKPFRDLKHRNISRLYGRCLEHDPFLLLFEYCTNGDLKSFLVTNSGSRNAITEQKISLKMMIDVTEGLKFMNEHGFIHTDLAARNCLVASDLTVKIGDYGTSVDKYKNEYYIVGDVAVPIRWCAPESLTCTQTTIETKEVTEGGNVWSLAVLLWEIAEFGKLPYNDLPDDQVITRVLVQGMVRLPPPNCSFGHYLHNIMTLCWKSENRANIEQVLSMLVYLKSNPFQESDFEARWKTLKPNTVAVVDNHTPIHSPRHTELAQRPHLTAKLEFDSGVDLEIKPTDENPDSCRTSTPNTVSPQLSVASEEIFHPVQHKSPSLTNLKGSLEDVAQYDSWLMGVEQNTEEDRKFAKNISEAIKNLDETLAMEKTSSSSQDSSMEGSKKPLLEFKLGPTGGEKKGDSSSSDTEEETWRYRIERGEFTEKVKEKSKSVTDLMVLTHIDSEGSESDSLPSLTRQYSLKKTTVKGVSYTGIGFGSEGNIRNAVLSEELQDKLKQLSSWKTDTQSFLVKGASEKNNKNIASVGEEQTSTPVTSTESDVTYKPLISTPVSSISSEGEKCIVNSTSCDVNTMAVICEKKENNVNTECTKDGSEVSLMLSVETSAEVRDNESECNRSTLDCNEAASSHSRECSVPKIVVTESEMLQGLDEPESTSDTQYSVNIKPRKFVFVCRDEDSYFGDDKSLKKNNVVEDDLIQKSEEEEKVVLVDEKDEDVVLVHEKEEKIVEPVSESSCSVILGSCEEHTLDYFKGLKTTFTPNISYVNDCVSEGTIDDLSDPIDEQITKERSSHVEKYADELQPPAVSCLELNDVGGRLSPATDLFGINEEPIDMVESVEEFSNSNLVENELSLPHTQGEGKISSQPDEDIITSKPLEHIINSFLDSERSHTTFTLVPVRISSLNVTTRNSIETSGKENGYFPDKKETENSGFGRHEVSVNPSKVDSTLSSGNCSEEHLVAAPFPFNQPEATDIHSNITSVKAKSLDSFLSPKNGFEHFVTLRNGIYVEDDSLITNYAPVFNMTESVSENAFMSKNLYYDPYLSVDSGHSSDRCMEQDKKMNDLKNRLEDVAKSGNDYQLKNSEEEYGGKLLTPDDERSSDSGFRDKGSLSESVEDTCDEKYNLEDIDAELDDFTIKNMDKEELKYYEQFMEADNEKTPGWFLHARPEVIADEGKDNGWLSQSTEGEERIPLTIDAEFAAAIRNELKEKLPCAQQVEKAEEETSPEQEPSTEKFSYASQLSPILEEQESNQSSLQLNDSSPVFVLPLPEIKTDTFKDDIVKAFESLESSKNGIIIEDLDDDNGLMVFNEDKIMLDDDVLIVDTETNEATLIESPKPQSHLAFILTKKEPDIFLDDDSPEMNSDIYVLTPDNAPLTPNSVNTDSHSSPENANMSGLFLSPCSIRSDLFDSGPPSLPFDLGQSLEEVEDIPVSEETVIEKPISESNCGVIENSTISDGFLLDQCGNNGSKNLENGRVELLDDERMKSEEHRGQENSFEANLNKGMNDLISVEGNANDNPFSSAKTEAITSSFDEKLQPKHVKAELQIDRLLSVSNKENFIDNSNQINSVICLKNDWLKDLFTNNLNCSDTNVAENENHINGNLPNKDWPIIDDLISQKQTEKCEQNNRLKPNITSTLALMSPDLSSADSKSLISSFSSTPSSDENKTVAALAEDGGKSVEKATKPSSLSLKSDTAGAPMPSPEDAEKGWRPTICQLMELTDQAAAEGEEMTTSFIEPDENGIYTPDWESDISEEQSSSSEDFVWKEGDKEDLIKCVASDTNSLSEDITGAVMERIEEEDEECSSGCEDSDTSSETSSGTEFVPSTWNAMAVPLKPTLRISPFQKKSENKKVIFKKEKYQCIYEYPREESDNEEEDFSPGMWQTPNTPVFDYMFADWELGEAEISTPIDSIDSDSDESKKTKKDTDFDFYRLDYNPGPHIERPWSDTLPEDDSEFSPLASDLAPVRLGDLRHTKATLRLELPQLRPDQGEASILDAVSDIPQ